MLRVLALSVVSIACTLVPQEEPVDGPRKIELETIMGDPNWIGRFPRKPYWGPKSEIVYYFRKNPEDDRDDLQALNVATRRGRLFSEWERGTVPVAERDQDAERRRSVFARNGDLFLLENATGDETQLTRTSALEQDPHFLLGGERIAFRRDGDLFVRDLATGLESEPAVLRFEEDPESAEDDPDYLEREQKRLIETLRVREGRRTNARERERQGRVNDPSRVPPPWYLGDGQRAAGTELSPDERFLFLRLVDDLPEAEKVDRMPEFVTDTSWVEFTEVRPTVGLRSEHAERLALLDLGTHERFDLDLSVLPGILDDPLAWLDERGGTDGGADAAAEEGGEDPEHGREPRGLAVLDARWSPDGTHLVFLARSLDNKDRWIARVDPETGTVHPIHHLHDEAWICWRFNELGWLRGGSGLWFTSEETGWSQLYLWSPATDEIRALTEGQFEIDQVEESPSGDALWFRANPEDPGIHEVCRLPLPDGPMEIVTRLGGRTGGVLSPDGKWLLLTHSKATSPPELWLQEARAGAEAEQLTHFASDDFLSHDWVEPEYASIPARDGATIHARVYAPSEPPGGLLPAVVFVHGAGYLQNAHRGWSGYFREFMFHSFLVQEGYVVIDADYRASAGYGRDWRTAIYRNMGEPELDDLLDSLDWLVEHHPVDPMRIGIYGGSYGGFLTLMALFQQPGLYRCGAALRPVTDWAHYNHGYTSDILNTPERDPAAFESSSPIEYAEGLEDALLICHGMVDDNVLVKDSIRLAQRLIELGKEHWELALYPVEGHAFREPSSWLDEYRRVFALFETWLK